MKVKEVTLENVAYAARNIRLAIEYGDTIEGEMEWLEEQLGWAIRDALKAGCTMDEITETIQTADQEVA